MRVRSKLAIVALAAFAAVFPASATDIGFEGWGVRGGVSDSLDQVVFGVHVNMGEFVDNLRFRPAFEAGFGDDATVLLLSAPVHFVFEVGQSFQPYVGGGIGLGWVDFDDADSETEIGLFVTGGLEWQLKNDSAVGVEVDVHFDDIYDAQLMATWSF